MTEKRKPIKARALSMERYRARGYLCGITEVWNSHVGIRQDLFGFIDFVAIGDGRIVAVQCCAVSGLGSHRRKICEECRDAASRWLEGGGEIELHGWRRKEVPTKPGAKSPVKNVLEQRVSTITLEEIEQWNTSSQQAPPAK